MDETGMDETAARDDARPKPAGGTKPAALDQVVERWWEDHFPGSPVAQVTTIWNYAFAAKQELKRRLVNLVRRV